MSSWIYVFSKFTPEALLFEALIIFALSVGYTAFWVLQKRKLGVIHSSEMPTGVVKGYLSQLILDAEQLRAQLFGLLAAAGSPMPYAHAPVPQAPVVTAQPAGTQPAGDPDAQRKLAALEAKMAEQAKAMDAFMADKARMEKELIEARAKGGGGTSAEVPKLQEKIQTLESKLAEYSVIEDDLANLKRLQQENAQLKASLGKPSTSSASSAKTAPAAKAEAAPDANFEGLVDQVEASLQNAAISPSTDDPLSGLENLGAMNAADAATSDTGGSPLDAMSAPPAGTSSPALEAAPPTSASSSQKSDEDLVAEFEKMLNS